MRLLSQLSAIEFDIAKKPLGDTELRRVPQRFYIKEETCRGAITRQFHADTKHLVNFRKNFVTKAAPHRIIIIGALRLQ